MIQSIRIAVRNISRQKKRSVLLGSAVAFGFLVITLVNGFTAGALGTTKTNLAQTFGGHIYIGGTVVSSRGTELSLIENDTTVKTALAKFEDRIASIQYRSRSSGTLYFGTKERSQKIEGIDFSQEKEFPKNVEIQRGSLRDIEKDGSLILPDDTAKKLGAEIGDTLLFKTSTISGQQNVGEFTLIATTVSSSILALETGYTGRGYLNSLIGIDGSEYQTINITLKNVAEIQRLADSLYGELARLSPVESRFSTSSSMGPGNVAAMRNLMGLNSLKAVPKTERWEGTKFSLTTIEDLMAPVLSLVNIMNAVSFGVFLILLLIIMVGILNSYRMVMIERTEEIGTMRALGVQKGGIRTIFMAEALSISALGALGGYALALLIAVIVMSLNFSGSSVLSIFLIHGHFTVALSPIQSLRNFLLICVMSLVAVSMPARRAANLKPAEALRATY
jgi:putative ABC transport system permease protein